MKFVAPLSILHLKITKMKSQTRVLRKAALSEGITIDAVCLNERRKYSSEKMTTLWLTKSMDSHIAKELKDAVKNLTPLIAIKLVDERNLGANIFLVVSI